MRWNILLAHHETFIQVIQYVLALILMGWIMSKTVFPMIGQWIIDLNTKMQKRITKLKADEDKWKQGVEEQFEKDVQKTGMEALESKYAERWIQEEQKPDEEALFLDQCKKRKDGKINIGGTDDEQER